MTVTILSAYEAAITYREAPFSVFCEQAGIPTGAPIPERVYDLACEAFEQRCVGYIEHSPTVDYLTLAHEAELRRKAAQAAALTEAHALLADWRAAA